MITLFDFAPVKSSPFVEKETVWVSGYCEEYKRKALFEAEIIEREVTPKGTYVIMGDPFLARMKVLEKSAAGTKEKPYVYGISVTTYEKVTGKKNAVAELINYLSYVTPPLKEYFDECREELTRFDEYILSGYIQNSYGLKEHFSLNVSREGKDKLELEYHLGEKNTLVTNSMDEIELFLSVMKSKLRSAHTRCKSPKTELQISVENMVDKYPKDYNTNTFRYRCTLSPSTDHLSLSLSGTFYRSLEDQLARRYETNEGTIRNSYEIYPNAIVKCNREDWSDKSNVLSLEALEEEIKSFLDNLKSKTVERRDSIRFKKKLRNEEFENTRLSEKKYQLYASQFQKDDKVTAVGLESMFGSMSMQGRIAHIGDGSIAILAKGKRNKGVILKIGSYIQSLEKGWI